MCDCFHLAFPNWHVAPSGTAGRRLRAPEPATQDDSICEEPTQFAEGERPRPQGSSPVQEYPEAAKYADKECEEHDADHKAGSGHKGKKSVLGSIFERTSTPKMSKLKEAPSPEGGVIVNTAQDGCAEGLVYGGGKEGIFIKKVVPESPASKSLKVKEGDQILSATVYFDNMSYEDAIQILEHAQAYKLKLCLKRQPDFTEMEPTIDSDVIPEEEVGSTEMREQGKTRRRGDARISWPKFPSFGKGRKSRFTRSHSSSEADEQRKLELSPTTSDTESPIKSQDALKGKKKHKIKLSGLKRRGRISSSEDQDTDAPTSGQMSSDVQQKQESDTLSPEFPEYPIAETPEINEQAGEAMESEPVQHKVELVSVDATLKTTDQTVALDDEEGQSGAPKSPDEKKERSELKMKILGKDKLHKKDAKAKSSPKRLKTLGASVDTEDLPEAGKSAAISSSESKTRLMGDQSTIGIDNKSQGEESSKLISSKFITSQIILPKVELDISLRKSPKKGDDKTQKGKETKQKQSKTSSPKHKQLELDMSNVANAEEMQTVNDQEPTTTTGRVSTTQLPKREDIEIPGMEDMSVKTTVADYKKRNKESQAETVQMSIDVGSVKEAVSKLPGFKLPQLDISGVPIPEEITVIDANAQRISVKTPTKVAKPKQEEHLTRSDTTASSEISKTIFLTDNKFDFKKSQMEDDTSPTKCKSEEETKEKEFDTTNGKAATKGELKTSTRTKITMPSFGMSAKSRRLPYIGIDMQKPSFIQEKELTTETRKDERQTGEVIYKVKIPELDGIEYIDSTDESVKKDGVLTSFNVSTDTKTILAISLESKETSDKPEDERNKLSKVRISPSGKPSGKEDISDEGTTKPVDRDGKSTFKWPNLDISVPKIKGTTVDINTSKKDAAHTVALAEGGQIPGGPESDTVLKSLDVPKEMAEAENPQVEIKPTETEGEFDWEASKCTKFGIKTPKIKGPEFDLSLSKKEAHGKAAGKLPEASKAEVSPGKGNVYFLKQKMQLEKPGEVKPLQSKGEHVQGGKIKIPKFGVKTTKLAGPEISLSKKDAEVTLPEAKPEIKLTGTGTGTDVNKDSVWSEEQKGMEKSDVKIKTLQKEGEAKRHGHKIKMPQLGIALPKVTTHESDLSLLKKGKDLTLPEVKGEIKDLEVEGTGLSTKLDVRAPGIKVETKDVEGSLSKFKMSPFKISRFGAATPNLSGEVSEASETHTLEYGPGTDVTIPDSDVKIKASEIDGRASKFKIPKFGISLPKLKGSETDTTQSQKVNVDVTLFKGDTEIKLTDAEHEEPGIRLKGKFPQIGVQQDVEYLASKPEIPVPFSDAKAEVKLLQVDGEKINFSSPVVLNETPELEIPTTKAEHHLAGQEEKMKLSKIGIKMPKIKGPEFQLGLSSKDTDVMETEGKVDNKTKVEVPVPTDVSLGKAEILISSGKVEVGKPEVQTQPTVEGQGGKFKMPKFGITMPKVKGPEAKKEVEVKLTETKTDIKIPDANFEAPDVEQSPSKFNMPTFKLPKLGLGTSDKNAEGDDIDKDIPDEVLAVTIVAPSSDLSNIDVDTHLFESKTEVALSSDDVNKYSIEVEATAPQIKVPKKEKEGSPSKFKMPTFKLPKFGLSVQSSTEKEPPLDKDLKTGEGQITTSGEILSTSLEAPRIDVKAPSVVLKTTGTESEGRGRKFKLPSLGFSASQTKGPDTKGIRTSVVGILPTTDVDITLPTTEVDVTAPEVKAEIQLPEEKFNKSFEVEAKAPEFKGTRKETEGSPSKFKMPTFKMPKFGLSGQSSTAEVPPLDKDLKTGEGEITTSGEILVGSLEAPRIDVKAPSVALETTETESEGRGRKFKLPSLGFSALQTKGPDTDIILPTTEVDISLPTTDVDITLPTTVVDVTAPEVKVEIQLPEEKFNKSFEVEAKAPEFKGTRKETEGSPSKFKMPTFKMPKFGLSGQSSTAEVPPLDKDLKTGEGKITTSGEILVGSLEAPRIDVKAPSVALKTTGTESEGRGRKFKLPSLGFSASQTKGPDTDIILPTTEVDISLPATDVHVTAPEVKAEIQIPEEKLSKSFEVEAKAPEFKGTRKETEGSPSKFKMPTFKMPKFGLSGQSSTAEVPPLDKDLKIPGGEMTMSEEVIVVSTEEPSVEIGDLSIESKKEGSECEGKGKRFKLPSLGFSATQAKVPDTDFSLKTGVDVTQPEIKAEVKFPDNELKRIETEIETKAPEFQVEAKDIEGSTSKFKMPTFKLPKFGLATQSSTEEVPSFDKDVKIGGGETTGLEEVLTVTTEGPSVEIKGTSVDLRTEGSDLEGKGRKFKLPSLSFSVPQAKEPETDLSLRTDVDVKVPEVKAEIKLPSNKSVEVETKALETKDTKKSTEGSPSKFKMPNFKLPKFGLATQTSTGEVPPLDEDVKPVKGKITTSEEVIVVTTEAPTIEIKGPLLELKTEGIDREEKGKKFKLPSLGFSASEAKGTGSDLGLSKTEVDVTLPEVKAEVKLPDDENLIKTSTAIEIKGPETKTVTKDTDGSPSKFKMPAFKLPKFGLTTQSSTEEGSPLEKDEEDGEPKNTVTAIETKTPEITVVSKDTDGSPSKFKMPTFKLPKFGLATQSSNKQVQDVKTVRGESTTLEEVLTVTREEPSIKIKGPSVDLRSSETDDERKGSKFKLPSLGFSLSQSKGPNTNISLPKADVDVTAPEVKAEVKFSSAKVEQPSVQMDIKSPEIKADMNTTSEVKMPKITLPTFGAVTPHVSMEISKMTKEKRGDVDLHVDTDPVDLNVKEGELKKYEVQSPSAEAKGEDVPTVELEGKVKRLNWTFPSISFSRTGGKAPDFDVNMETPKAGVTSMETKISDVDIKESSAVEATPGPELDPGLKKSKFSLPKFSFSKPSLKEPEVKVELPDHGIEVENYETDMTTEIKLSADEDKNVLTAFEMTTSEAEVKSKTFQMPTLKMPRFGSVSYEVTTETHISDKTAEDDGSQLGEGAAVIIKGPKTDFKSDARKSEQQDQETLNTESDSVVQGSPSKFKLPTFKMPRLGLSRSKLEDESVHFEYENSENQLEMKTAPKEDLSQKLTLTSFGDILKSIDVDFDVRKVDKVDQDVETSKQSHEPGEATTKQTSAKTKHDTTKSPESSSWFKFPKFGLSSPTEQQKIPDKAEQVKDSSPVGETKDEEVSPTLSVQSSDAFADVSSTITSEPVGPVIPSPTKVTVKYSDESAGAGFEEMHSDIMTSTTRTELITDVPTLPEKVTILSSGVSSSSEDTVRLTSGKIHIITSNVQPTPESQHAKILSAVQVQSGEGFALQSEGDDAPLWTVQDARSATRTVKHLVQETTTERSENKETVVITKQITHIFGPTEPISGETASSIQRLKDSVHTEKMRFFDEAEK